jgi:hypothetical protein
LRAAGGTNSYGSLAVSRNTKTGNLFAMFLEQGSSGSVLGLHIKPDGTLFSSKLIQFQSLTANLRSVGQAAFDNQGKGFGIWSDNTALKFRQLSGLGMGPLKMIDGAADVNSIQTSLSYDALYNQYYAVWTQGSLIRGATINANNGALIKQPFQIANATMPHSRNAFCVYNPQSATVLVAWEDSNADTTATGAFRVRAAIFSAPGPQPNFTGTWIGSTSQKHDFQFAVGSGGIKSMRLGYSIKSGGCSLNGTTAFTFGSPVAINGTSFSISLSGSTTSYKIAGTFKSATTASGTLEVKSMSLCSGTVKATWNAAKK